MIDAVDHVLSSCAGEPVARVGLLNCFSRQPGDSAQVPDPVRWHIRYILLDYQPLPHRRGLVRPSKARSLLIRHREGVAAQSDDPHCARVVRASSSGRFGWRPRRRAGGLCCWPHRPAAVGRPGRLRQDRATPFLRTRRRTGRLPGSAWESVSRRVIDTGTLRRPII